MNIAKYLFLLYFLSSSFVPAPLSDYYYLLALIISFVCNTYTLLNTKA